MRYLLILSFLLLSSCSSFFKEADNFNCPELGFVSGTDNIDLENVKATIKEIKAVCILKDKNKITVELELPFIAKFHEDYAIPEYPEVELSNVRPSKTL